MEIDTIKIRELLDKRDAIDKEIVEAILAQKPERKPQACGMCGETGHSSRTCPKKTG